MDAVTALTGQTADQARRHLADPCLAVAALRASPKALLADWSYTGLLFEAMALRDVRVYLDATGGTTYHYRDSNGLEVDIIAELDDGRWGAIEVKIGENRIEEGAESLARFAHRRHWLRWAAVLPLAALGIDDMAGVEAQQPRLLDLQARFRDVLESPESCAMGGLLHVHGVR